ncbi:hypothetical protein Tco_0044496 [Tanacetum coccineum]
MVLVDHTGWKLRRRQWTGTTEQLIEELESTYDNAPNMFSIRIHHGGKFQSYPGRMYVSGRVDIFDMVDIDLFTIVALNMMVLKLGYTGCSLPGYPCFEPIKLIEVYIEHGVTVLDSYLRAPRFRATLEDITDEPAGSIAANRTEKMLLLTWHESSETTKEPVIDDVMRQLSFDETELDGEAGFADVCGVFGQFQVKSDESLESMTRTLNLNEPVNLNVSQVETQSELPVSEEPDVGPTQEPILAERLALRHPLWKRLELSVEDYVSSGENGEDAEQVNGQEDESAPTDGQFFSDDEGIDTAYETEYEVPDLVKMQNEIVEPDVDVYLFGISMDLPFDNIGVTNLVLDDVLEGEDVDVANADGFDSDPGNDEEKNYKKRRLAELRTEMEGVINASGQWKYSFYTGQEFTTPKEAKIASICNPIESIGFEAI